MRGNELTQGANVFNGDTVETAKNGETVLNLGHNATARVPADSDVRFFKCGEGSVLQLLRGEVIFRATPQQPVEVHLADATVRTTPQLEAIGRVAMTSPTTANISAIKGSMTVTAAHEGKTLTLHEGEATNATLSSPPSGASPNPPVCEEAAAVPAQSSTSAWVKLSPIIAAAALGASLGLNGRQTTLTCPQKGALVSPYQFGCP